MRKTTIDIGTNTILMLIADFNNDKEEITTIFDVQRIPRLGKGVDKNRNILPESIEKAVMILNEYRQISHEHGSDSINATATSFLRDSHNKDEFLKIVKANTGIDIEILSGEDEAKFTFIGGIYRKFPKNSINLMTIDIGGGSTEITASLNPINGSNINSLIKSDIIAKSFDVGSVRIKEKYFVQHPPSNADIKAAEEFILNHLLQFDKSGKTDKPDKFKLIGVAGTITTLGAIKLGLDRFITEKVDNLELSSNEISYLIKSLSSKSLNELYSMGNYMEGRADIIIPGILILKCFMEQFGFEKLTISTKGLRYGIFLREIYKN